MASTYTDGLAVEIIGSGDKAGSWGDVTNNNLKALEQGVRGFSTIALTGTSTTVNLPDGETASETSGDARIRSSVVRFTGASGDHTVTLQVGGTSTGVKTSFIAINALDSTHSLIIDVGGTDATIPNGYAAHVHVNGTTVTNSFANLAVDKIALKNTEIISNETDNEILIGADKVILGDGTGDVTLESNGNNNLIVQTGHTNTGTMTIVDGSNGDISITPHGTGKVVMDKVNIGGGEIDGTPIGANSANTGAFTTLAGTTSVTTPLVTNNAAMSITTTASNGDISITPHSSGKVVMDKVNIGGGEIDATPIGANSANTGAFTTLSATGTSTLAAINASGNIATTGSASITSAAGLALSGAITGATTIGASGEITAGSVDTPDLHNAGTLDISTTGTNPLTIIANSALATIRGGTTALEGNTVTVASNGNAAVNGVLSLGRQGTSTAASYSGQIVAPLRTSESVAVSTTKMLFFGDNGREDAQQIVFNVDDTNSTGSGVNPASQYRFTVGDTGSDNNRFFINNTGIRVYGTGGSGFSDGGYLNFMGNAANTGANGVGLRSNGTTGMEIAVSPGVWGTPAIVSGGDLSVSGSVITPTLTSTGALAINTASNGNLTVAPNGTGTISISSGLDSTSATGGIGLSTSNSRIVFATTSSTYSKGLITFKAKDYGTDGTDGSDSFQFVVNQHGVYLHDDGGQYLNFTSGSGPTGNGIRGDGSSAIEIKSKTGTGGSGTVDNWGRIYHSGMVNGDGAYFEVTQTDVSASSVTTHSTSFSAIPSIVTCYLKCTSDEQGYTTGDHILVSSTSVFDTGHTGLMVTFDGESSDDITVTVGDGGLYVLHKANGNEVALDESKWDLVIKAWK